MKTDVSRTEHGRGRQAKEPSEIPAPGWWDILIRVKTEIGSDHVTLVAAGLGDVRIACRIPGIGRDDCDVRIVRFAGACGRTHAGFQHAACRPERGISSKRNCRSLRAGRRVP